MLIWLGFGISSFFIVAITLLSNTLSISSADAGASSFLNIVQAFNGSAEISPIIGFIILFVIPFAIVLMNTTLWLLQNKADVDDFPLEGLRNVLNVILFVFAGLCALASALNIFPAFSQGLASLAVECFLLLFLAGGYVLSGIGGKKIGD